MNNYKIYDNVILGKNVEIGDYVIIGLPPRGTASGELKTIIGDNAVIRSHTVIYAGNTIGNDFQTGHHVMIRESNAIGDNVSIGTGSCVEYKVKIEDNVRIHSQVFIPEYSMLEKNCWIGPNVVLTNAKYPKSRNVKDSLKGPVIKKNAKIGANTTILPAINIGENTLIGAGSVIVKDVPPNKVVVGNPGRIIKDVGSMEEYK